MTREYKGSEVPQTQPLNELGLGLTPGQGCGHIWARPYVEWKLHPPTELHQRCEICGLVRVVT